MNPHTIRRPRRRQLSCAASVVGSPGPGMWAGAVEDLRSLLGLGELNGKAPASTEEYERFANEHQIYDNGRK